MDQNFVLETGCLQTLLNTRITPSLNLPIGVEDSFLIALLRCIAFFKAFTQDVFPIPFFSAKSRITLYPILIVNSFNGPRRKIRSSLTSFGKTDGNGRPSALNVRIFRMHFSQSQQLLSFSSPSQQTLKYSIPSGHLLITSILSSL